MDVFSTIFFRTDELKNKLTHVSVDIETKS